MMTTAHTRYGTVRGTTHGDVLRFAGIPFARPPAGGLRFRPPEPPDPWTGERDAIDFGPSAPQVVPGAQIPFMDVGRQDEDCLHLNVWTPSLHGSRPVMVWIHGGAFVLGSSSQHFYRGDRLAARGDVVVVTINYRLGALGFSHLADLCGDEMRASGNVGLLDQVAALEWVRDNVAGFGGDPANVTVFGESAGAMSIGALLALPQARSLFSRAILQSGAAHSASQADNATAVAEMLLSQLDIPPRDLSRLQEVPWERIVDAQARVIGEVGGLGRELIPYQPVIDGVVLDEVPIEAVRRGEARDLTLLVGTNVDEFKMFSMMLPMVSGEQDLTTRLDEVLAQPGAGRRLAEAYQAAHAKRGDTVEARELWDAILGDRVFRIPAIRLAEAQASADGHSYMYLFTWRSPLMGGVLGSCHALDLPFVFDALDDPFLGMFAGTGPETAQLSKRMQQAWLSFARTSDPSTESLGTWPRYDAISRATMILGAEPSVRHDPMPDERQAWEGIL